MTFSISLLIIIISSAGSFFFFQAEDGIRDVAVTGVQTCALPILVRGIAARPDADRCEGMPLPHLPARKDRIAAELRKTKRSVRLQSIWTEGPAAAVALSSVRRVATARATLYKLLAPGALSPSAATGFPVSPPIRITGSISISPSTGTP